MSRVATWVEAGGVIAMILACVGLTYGAMRLADRLVNVLGRTGADVVSRISGILLAGLAVQFIFDGLFAAPFFVR